MYKKIAFVACMLCTTVRSVAFGSLSELFDHQIQMMEQVRDAMHMNQSQIQAGFSSAAIQEDSIKGVVQIIVPSIESESFEATVDEDEHALTIKAGDNKVSAHTTRHNVLFVRVEKKHGWSHSVSESAQSVSRTVDLENPTIEYDADKKELTISLEFEHKKLGKPIPVTINAPKRPDDQPLGTTNQSPTVCSEDDEK